MMFDQINTVIQGLITTNIPKERKLKLDILADYIRNNKGKSTAVTFVCTHNSRRSIFCQVWAQTLAAYFKIPYFNSFSAGTETTQIYKSALSTLTDVGFKIQPLSEGNNPIYTIKFADTERPILLFSKTITHKINPTEDFAAIMTCGSADQACPNVNGAQIRLAITYDDPKSYDKSPKEQEEYLKCCIRIASEFLYLFNQLQ